MEEMIKLLKVSIEEELKSDHPNQYAAIKNKNYPKKLPNFVIKFFDTMEKLTDKPAEWLLKLRRKL
jgi:hypothetical protein